MKTSINEENSYHWYGNVGLLNPSDFIRASMNSECNSYKYFWDTNDCKNDNYLYKSDYGWWFMAMNQNSAAGTFIYAEGSLGSSNGTNYASTLSGVRPVLYLKSDTKLSGEGTKENPYMIK